MDLSSILAVLPGFVGLRLPSDGETAPESGDSAEEFRGVESTTGDGEAVILTNFDATGGITEIITD